MLIASKCRWCHSPLPDGSRASIRYCQKSCRDNMRNLRMARGGELHDALMVWAGDYRQRKTLTDIGRIVRAWIEEDIAANRGLPDGLWQWQRQRRRK